MVKGTTHTTYVVTYKHSNVTVVRHFKESHEMHKHISKLWDEINDVQVERITTTRTPMPKLIERLYKGNV